MKLAALALCAACNLSSMDALAAMPEGDDERTALEAHLTSALLEGLNRGPARFAGIGPLRPIARLNQAEDSIDLDLGVEFSGQSDSPDMEDLHKEALEVIRSAWPEAPNSIHLRLFYGGRSLESLHPELFRPTAAKRLRRSTSDRAASGPIVAAVDSGGYRQ